MTGYFGKVSTRGDFVGQGLPPSFVQVWDDWLQRCLQASRAQLGGRWLAAYLTSPVWRFALAPQAAGEQAWGGLMMPSVDRVGRHFPLMLAAPGVQAPWAWFQQHAAWYDQLEELARASLEPGFAPELLATAAQPAPVQAAARSWPASCVNEAAPRAVNMQHESALARPAAPQPMASGDLHAEAGWIAALAQGAMLRMDFPAAWQAGSLAAPPLARHSLWWSEGSDDVAPSLLVCRGLPRPEGFSAMLQGSWSRYGWTNV